MLPQRVNWSIETITNQQTSTSKNNIAFWMDHCLPLAENVQTKCHSKTKREYYGHWGTAGYFLCNSFCKLVADVWCRFCYSGTRTRAECQHGEWVWLGWANPIFCGFIDVVCALIKVHCSQTWFTCSLNDLNYCAFDLILNVHLYTNFWILALAL